MHIVEVDKQRGWTGQTQQTLNIAIGLQRQGVEVTVVAHSKGELAKRAEAAGIRTLRMPLYGIGFHVSVVRVWAYCLKHRVQVIHCHGPRDHLLAAAVRLMLGARHMVRTRHFHSPLNSGIFSRLLFAPCKSIVGVSQYIVDLCETEKLPKRKLKLIYEAVDTKVFRDALPAEDLKQRIKQAGSPLVIGHVSTLDERKGCDVLIRAFAAARSRLSRDARLVLVGHKPERWQPLIDQMVLGEQVWCLGVRRDVPRVLKCFDFFVMPSRAEALGVAALEAMASGLPVIATRTGGLAESVNDEIGRHCEPGDVATLSEVLVELGEDVALRSAMSEAARDRSRAMFDIDAMARRYRDLFESY